MMIKIDGLPYWRLSGFYFIFFLTMGAFVPYWPLYLKSLGMTAESIGSLCAVVVVTRIFSALIWGWVADHTGKPMQIIQLTSLLSIISFSAVFFYEDFWSLFIILFIFSIFWNAALPQIDASTLSHLGQHSHRYTVIRVWGSISFIIAVLILGQFFDQQPIAYVLPILLIAMIFVWLHSLLIPENRPQHDETTNGITLQSILYRPHVIALMSVCFLIQVGHGAYYTFFSIYLKEYQYTNSFIGIAWAVGVFAEIIVYFFTHRLIVQYNLKTLMLITLILATLRWFLIACFVENVAILLFAQSLHAATFGVYHAVAIQYIHREFKGVYQGRGQGLYNSISFGAGIAVGSLMSGYIWNIAGSMVVFAVATFLSGIGVLIAWVWLQTDNHKTILR